MTVDNALQTAVRDGVGLAYANIGVGSPPLLFIHGWCCDRTHWREQVIEFQDRHWTVAVDLRGHGESDKPDQDYGIAGFVDDVAWLCREIGLEKPIVVGHSMGGVIGMNLARKHPDIARALVMVDSPVIPIPDALQPVLAGTLAAMQSAAYVETAKNFVSTFMFREDSDPAFKASIIDGMAAAPRRLMWSALGSTVAPENIAPGPIPVPTLFMRASTQISSADDVRSRYPGVEVQDIDAAHFLQMENPEAFNDVLRRFIEEVA